MNNKNILIVVGIFSLIIVMLLTSILAGAVILNFSMERADLNDDSELASESIEVLVSPEVEVVEDDEKIQTDEESYPGINNDHPEIGRSIDSVIIGDLGFPSHGVPKLQLCAVNVNDADDRYCVVTRPPQFAYSISVPAGDYYVIANSDYTGESQFSIAYHTYCDTFDDVWGNDECSGQENGEGASRWSTPGFICYEDEQCKNAYTPVVVSANSEKPVQANILFGWYVKNYLIDPNDPNSAYDKYWEKYIQ